MNVAEVLDSVFTSVGPILAFRGTAVLEDSHSVRGTLSLAAELTSGSTAPTIANATLLQEQARVPTGLSLTIGGDTYTTDTEARVEDGALTLSITPLATTTYAASTAVVLDDAVSWDLVALHAEVVASGEAREPGTKRQATEHKATVYVLQSKLPDAFTVERLREMELTIDGRNAPIMNAVDEDPHWALIAGGGGI